MGEEPLTAGALGVRDKRLLLILPKGIGDVIYGLAVVTAIKASRPDLEITWVTQPLAAPLLQNCPALARVVTYAPAGGLAALVALRRQLRTDRFDLVLNLGMYLHALPPALLARAGRRLGFARGYARDGLYWFHGERMAAPRDAHVMDVYRAALQHLGLPPAKPSWNLALEPRELALRDEFFAAAANRPRVAFVPCSGRPEKDWPAHRYGELAKRLQAAGAFVVVTGGPSAAEAWAADLITGCAPDTRRAVGDDLRRVLWLLSGCDLLVAGDTGPIHMARALGTPVVGLYGHTDPRRYGPYPPFRGSLIDRYRFDGPGLPDTFKGRGGRSGRMELIGVDEVESACASVLCGHVSANAGQKQKPT